MSQTIGSRLAANGGVGPGFGALRVILALAILTYHSFDVVRGPGISTGRFWLLTESLLPMFFALSGFLITASAQRLDLSRFLLFRGLRIFPALFVEVLFSAFILGIVVTKTELSEYVTSPQVYSYILNVFGDIHYTLPGVYTDHPHAQMVNASLWTIPWELTCYVLMSAAILTGFINRMRTMIVIAGLAALAPAFIYGALQSALYFFPHSDSIGRLLQVDVYFNRQHLDFHNAGLHQIVFWLLALVTGWQFRVISFFFAGSVMYLARHSVMYSLRSTQLIVIGLIILSALAPEKWDTPLLNLMLCPAIVYLTVFIGVSELPNIGPLKNGDYSYGIYLYAYPLQQAVFQWNLDRKFWVLNALVSSVLVSLFAASSWHLIEEPILSRRRKLERWIWKAPVRKREENSTA